MAQTLIPGLSVSRAARRYDVNTNLVFTWRRGFMDEGAVFVCSTTLSTISRGERAAILGLP